VRLIRVFPRKTNATPDDDLAIIGRPPTLFDEADEVRVSVAFTWDIPLAEKLAQAWRAVAPVSIGGPAYNDRGAEFTPGLYLRRGYTITSRGCPNSCWFCNVWRSEGRNIRELEVKDGWILQDNNILACSLAHQEKVYNMLLRQRQRPSFTGGMEAARFTSWHAEWLAKLKPRVVFFAYDTPNDYEPLVNAASLLDSAGLLRGHKIACFVLIGFPGDTLAEAEARLTKVVGLGFFPQSMLFRDRAGKDNRDKREWRRFHRAWANKRIVGLKMRTLLAGREPGTRRSLNRVDSFGL
jgi:hypothetical protein